MENIYTKTVKPTKAYGRRENHSNYLTPSAKTIVLMFDYYFMFINQRRTVISQAMTITRNPTPQVPKRPAD